MYIMCIYIHKTVNVHVGRAEIKMAKRTEIRCIGTYGV